MARDGVLAELALTCEVCAQTTLGAAALRVYLTRLAAHPSAAIIAALRRCQTEVHGHLSLAAIIERLPKDNPPPGPALERLLERQGL